MAKKQTPQAMAKELARLKADLVTKAQVGDTVTVPGIAGESEHTYVVKAACDNSTNGRWYCATHKEGFQNQLQKDIHIGYGKAHRLVWACLDHGPEQP